MKKLISGMGMLICVIFFVLEINLMKFMLVIENANSHLHMSIWDYSLKAPYSIGILATLMIFIFSEWHFFTGDFSLHSKEENRLHKKN